MMSSSPCTIKLTIILGKTFPMITITKILPKARATTNIRAFQTKDMDKDMVMVVMGSTKVSRIKATHTKVGMDSIRTTRTSPIRDKHTKVVMDRIKVSQTLVTKDTTVVMDSRVSLIKERLTKVVVKDSIRALPTKEERIKLVLVVAKGSKIPVHRASLTKDPRDLTKTLHSLPLDLAVQAATRTYSLVTSLLSPKTRCRLLEEVIHQLHYILSNHWVCSAAAVHLFSHLCRQPHR